MAVARTAIARFIGWALTGMLAAALVCALAVIGTTTALRTHGVQVATVLSGSMTPTFRAGDAVLIKPAPKAADLAVGQVITFRAPGEDRLTTHRIHAIIDRPDGRFVQTKGDANATPDANFTPAADVVGIMGKSIPGAGKAVAFYSQPRGRLLVLGIPLTLLLISQVVHLVRLMRRDDDQDNTPAPPRQPRTRTQRAKARSRIRRTRAAVGALAFTAVLGTGAASTGAVFAASTTGATAAFSAAADFCTGTGGYSAVVAADNPALHWTHDSAAADASATAPAQAYGAVTYGATGAVGCSTSVTFGTNGSLSAKDKTTADGTFTIETWLRSAGSPAAQIVGFGDKRGVSGTSSDHDRILYLTSTGAPALTVAGTSGRTTITGPAAVTDGHWHHLVVTYSPAAARLFVDGVQVASTVNPVTPATWRGYWRAGYDTLTGVPSATGFGSLDADLDQTAVYDTALSPARVAAHHGAGR